MACYAKKTIWLMGIVGGRQNSYQFEETKWLFECCNCKINCEYSQNYLFIWFLWRSIIILDLRDDEVAQFLKGPIKLNAIDNFDKISTHLFILYNIIKVSPLKLQFCVTINARGNLIKMSFNHIIGKYLRSDKIPNPKFEVFSKPVQFYLVQSASA